VTITSANRSKRSRTGAHSGRRKRPRLIDRIQLWSSTRKRIDGLWVGTIEGKSGPILERVEAALALIKAYNQTRYNRLARDLDRIWVRLIPYGLACYNKSINACEIDTRFVLAEDSTPELIASAIVHEATHARLTRCGIGYEQELRARVEAVCFRREIAFAVRLPNGGQARERAERSLQFYSADEFWTDAASRERFLEGATAALRHLGTPEWFVRIFASFYALRHRIPGSTRRPQRGQADPRQRWPGRRRP
jgi:hypothetical protein